MNKQRKAIFTLFMGWSGLTLLLSTFFLSIFGLVNLNINTSVEIDLALKVIVNTFLFHVSIFVLIYVGNRYSLLKSIGLTLLYLPVYLLSTFIQVEYAHIATFILPFTYILIINILCNKVDFRKVIYWFIIFTYQIISGYIKINGFNINYFELNSVALLFLSIDLFLFYAFLLKGVVIYEFLGKRVFLSEVRSIFKNAKTSEESLSEEEPLTKRQKIVFSLMVTGYQLFQILIVLTIGFINNMFIEILIILPIFWVSRLILNNCWHSNKLWICSVVTYSSFYILTKIIPPLEVSLFLIVAITGVFVYLFYVLGIKSDRLDFLENKYNTDFTKYGLTHEMSKFAYDYKIKGLSIKEQMQVTGLTYQVVKNYRSIVNNALKSHNVTF